MPPSTRTACFARVTAANFCFFLTFASFFLLPLHVRALGGTERTIGLVMGTSGLAGLVSVLALGALLDRFGRRIFLLGGIATMSAAAGGLLLVDRLGAATVACCGVSFGAVITYVPTFVQDAALGSVATFFLSYTAAAVLTRIGAGGLGDSLGRRTVVLPALGLLALSIALLATVRSAPALATAGLLFGTAQGFVYPTLNAFTIDLAEPGQLGRTQTLYNGAFNLGTTAGSMALGPVAHAFGHRVMFLVAAGVAPAALAVFRLRGGPGRAPPAPPAHRARDPPPPA